MGCSFWSPHYKSVMMDAEDRVQVALLERGRWRRSGWRWRELSLCRWWCWERRGLRRRWWSRLEMDRWLILPMITVKACRDIPGSVEARLSFAERILENGGDCHGSMKSCSGRWSCGVNRSPLLHPEISLQAFYFSLHICVSWRTRQMSGCRSGGKFEMIASSRIRLMHRQTCKTMDSWKKTLSCRYTLDLRRVLDSLLLDLWKRSRSVSRRIPTQMRSLSRYQCFHRYSCRMISHSQWGPFLRGPGKLREICSWWHCRFGREGLWLSVWFNRRHLLFP